MSTSSDPNNPYAPPKAGGALPPVITPQGGSNEPQFAPCPKCGCTFATKASFTWWGGMVGPAMFSHVNCKRCNAGYNGKNGKSNDVAIAIYISVSVLVALAFLGGMALAGAS